MTTRLEQRVHLVESFDCPNCGEGVIADATITEGSVHLLRVVGWPLTAEMIVAANNLAATPDVCQRIDGSVLGEAVLAGVQFWVFGRCIDTHGRVEVEVVTVTEPLRCKDLMRQFDLEVQEKWHAMLAELAVINDQWEPLAV